MAWARAVDGVTAVNAAAQAASDFMNVHGSGLGVGGELSAMAFLVTFSANRDEIEQTLIAHSSIG
jgi:hypothetical protein